MIPAQKFFLILILVLSFGTRLIFLKTAPEGFHKDEVLVGYEAYSISKTARDEFGKFLPPIFEALEDYRQPVVIYTTVPFVYLFGLDDFWIRFPTAFFGALTPLVLFFLVKNLTGNKKASIVASLLLAISPQHILFSRSVNEPIIALFTIVLAFYFLSNLLKKFSRASLLLGVLLLILSVFTYRTYFVFTPLILVATIIIYRKVWKNWPKSVRRFAIFTIGFFILSFLWFISVARVTRIKDINLLSSINVKQDIALQIMEDGSQNPLVSRVYHNKLLNFSLAYVKNYVSHFDLSYLFFTGDKLSGNNSTPWMGHLLLMDLPFLILGLVVLVRKRNFDLALAWFLIGPIASAGTVDSPSAVRNLVSTVAYSMIVVFGFNTIFELKRQSWQKVLIFGVIILYVANFVYFWHLFTVHKRVHQPWGRDFGTEQMVNDVAAIQNGYDKVVFADYTDLYIFLLYYEKIDPSLIQRREAETKFKDRKREILALINPKYSIMPKTPGVYENCPISGEIKTLYVCIGQRVPRNAKILRSVRYADGLPAFTLIKFDNRNDSTDLNEPLPSRYEYLSE